MAGSDCLNVFRVRSLRGQVKATAMRDLLRTFQTLPPEAMVLADTRGKQPIAQDETHVAMRRPRRTSWTGCTEEVGQEARLSG